MPFRMFTSLVSTPRLVPALVSTPRLVPGGPPWCRGLATSACRGGMVQFSKIQAFNKRGSKQFKKEQFRKWEKPGKYPDLTIHKYGVRSAGIRHATFWERVPEKVPELVVPDLDGCKLLPYVSYATKDLYQEELNSRDLFNVFYGRKIREDFKAGQLDSEGDAVEPSRLEAFTPEQARTMARQTGSDIFTGGVAPNPAWGLKWRVGKL